MPIYEYVCRSCSHELEQLQKVSDPPATDCPACGESSLARKISAAGFRLKGGGWYETDFKRDNRRNVVESGDGDKPAADKGGSDNGAGKAPESPKAADKAKAADKPQSTAGTAKSDSKSASS